MTRVLRVPEQVHSEAMQIAALRGQQPGHLIAEAWNEYIANHRQEFASDLEEAAKLLRDGTLDQLVAFTGGTARERAKIAAARLASDPSDE